MSFDQEPDDNSFDAILGRYAQACWTHNAAEMRAGYVVLRDMCDRAQSPAPPAQPPMGLYAKAEAAKARSVPEVPAAPSEALLDEFGKWWVPYRPNQAMPAAVEARDSAESELPVAHLRSITHPDWLELCDKDSPGAFPVYAEAREHVSERHSSAMRSRPDRFFPNGDGSYIEDDDFIYDAVLKIDGDFGEGQRLEYAKWLCSLLNATPQPGQQGRAQAADAAGSDVTKGAE